jgi:hypothetical protein
MPPFLRIVIGNPHAYTQPGKSIAVPVDADYVIDIFPGDQGSSSSDHADFINVIPNALMTEVVRLLNDGLSC